MAKTLLPSFMSVTYRTYPVEDGYISDAHRVTLSAAKGLAGGRAMLGGVYPVP
jgi:hypothetical protein